MEKESEEKSRLPLATPVRSDVAPQRVEEYYSPDTNVSGDWKSHSWYHQWDSQWDYYKWGWPSWAYWQPNWDEGSVSTPSENVHRCPSVTSLGASSDMEQSILGRSTTLEQLDAASKSTLMTALGALSEGPEKEKLLDLFTEKKQKDRGETMSPQAAPPSAPAEALQDKRQQSTAPEPEATAEGKAAASEKPTAPEPQATAAESKAAATQKPTAPELEAEKSTAPKPAETVAAPPSISATAAEKVAEAKAVEVTVTEQKRKAEEANLAVAKQPAKVPKVPDSDDEGDDKKRREPNDDDGEADEEKKRKEMELKRKKRKAHAAYMRFYRSLSSHDLNQNGKCSCQDTHNISVDLVSASIKLLSSNIYIYIQSQRTKQTHNHI